MNVRNNETEYDVFQRFINGLDEARDACMKLAIYRGQPEWQKVAASLEVTKQLATQLSGSGTIISRKGMS